MERTEPTFVPEWLKISGGLSTTSNQIASSSHSDEQGSLKSLRNKSLDKDLGRVSGLDRTTSSYFRRASINNGSASSRSYSSFNRNRRDRDWDKDINEFRNKERLENRHGDCSDSLGNVLPSRFEKDGLRRSRSSVSGKRGESWPRKDASELTIVNKSSRINGASVLSGNVKRSFERDFPSLGTDEKQVDSDIGRVSPGLSSAIQSLPVGNSTMIGGDGWTSALAEVPVIVSNNGNGSGVQPVQPVSISAPTSLTGGRNMAETLAHGPPRTQTTPQIVERVGKVAFKLELPQELSNVHPTFHISNLKKCLADENLHIPLEDIQIDESMHFVEKPVEIMDHEVKTLKRSRIPIVKVRWESKCGPEFTWEREDQMKTKYPHLFPETSS